MTQKTLGDYSSTGHECPECGRDDFGSDHAMKIHYGNAHDGSLAGFEHTCEICGDTFTHKSSDRKYCSRECFGKGHAETMSGENCHLWEGGPDVIECQNCGKSFESHRPREEKYCSQSCYGEDIDVSGQNNPMYQGKTIEVACEFCGESLERWESATSGGNFCDKECHDMWQRTKGAYGPEEIDDVLEFGYGIGFNDKVKEQVRERDNHKCQDCGLSQEQSIERYGGKLQVHHICGARMSTNPAVFNAKRNLVALCVSCHPHWEQHVPGIPPEFTQNYDNSRVSIERSEV